MEADRPPPWYKDRSLSSHPFSLKSATILSDGQKLSSVAIFPWDCESLSTLWHGELSVSEENQRKWHTMIEDFAGAIAVGGESRVFIKFMRPRSSETIRITVEDLLGPIRCVRWLLRYDLFEPHIAFTCSRLVYIYNVSRRRLVSVLRGHGGEIMCMDVHPIVPHLFCTGSRDFTVRIYDLRLEPTQSPNNPPWSTQNPSRAGAPHGLQMNEPEGYGWGQCVAVLVGGRSGGHRAAVLGVAFHWVHDFPLIATCGMDRAVKIWRLPPWDEISMAREDKPLFTSTMIHKAAVWSISWAADDVLLSHHEPALMRKRLRTGGFHRSATEYEAGGLVLWQWTDLNRFFPPDRSEIPTVMRGSAADFLQSGAFKIISRTTLPPLKPRPPAHSPFNSPRPLAVRQQLFHYQTHLHDHDPLIIYPDPDASLDALRIINAAHLPVNKPLPFPENTSTSFSGEAEGQEIDVVAMTKRMRIRSKGDDGGDGGGGGPWSSGNEEDDDSEDDRTLDGDLAELPPVAPTWVVRKARLVDGVPQLVPPINTARTKGKGKALSSESGSGSLPRGDDAATSVERIEACAMGLSGGILVGASNHGRLYVWLAVKK